jgi:hypothetical protein
MSNVTERPICTVEGCDKPRVLKDYYSAKPRYRQMCAKHMRRKRLTGKTSSCCEKCGWVGECHRHRIQRGSDGGLYTFSNIESLCPNCHAAAHGKGSWNSMQPTG